MQIKNLFYKINRMPDASKAAIGFMFVGFCQKGISFITGPIFTRILTTDQFGVLSVFNSWNEIIGIFAMLALSAGVFNNGMLEFKNDRNTFLTSMLGLSNFSTGILFIIYLIFQHKIDHLLSLPHSLLLLMFLGFFINPAMYFWTASQRFLFKYKLATVITLITSIISPLAAVICVLYSPADLKVEARAWSWQLSVLPIYLFFYVLILIRGKFKIKVAYWKYALAFNLPLIPHYLSLYVLSNSDRIIISKLIDVSSSGIYSVAYTVASAITIVWVSINGSLAPWTLQHVQDHQYKAINDRAKQLITLYGALCITIVFLAPEVMQILAPPSYFRGVYIIPPVVLGVYFTAIYTMFANIEFYYKSTKFIMIASLVAAILNILLNLLLIPVFGYITAGYTTMICYIVQAYMHYRNMKRIQEEKIYDIKYLLMLSAAITAICMFATLLYTSDLIRYLIIMLLIIVLCLNKRKIAAAIKVKN